MSLDAELSSEAEYLTAARAQLDAMRQQTRQMAAQTDSAAGDLRTRDLLEQSYARRLASLDIAEELPVSFGAMTTRAELTNQAGLATQAEKHYIGRRHIRAADGEAMVIDWRAPVVQAYYRASAADPQGLARRRRFGYAGGRLTAMEDETFDTAAPDELSAMVLAEIERPRVGPMRDIVSTIQADQDELVRAALDADLVIQGAPGTGKTAVGLHRAAYLLYAFSKQLAALGGVLVIGPSADFLRYIGDVLPALGETAVEHTTLPRLLGDPGDPGDPGGDEPPEVSALKHSAPMAVLLDRMMAGQFGPVVEPLAARIAYRRFRLPAAELERVRAAVLSRGQSHEGGRTVFIQRLAGLAVDATGAARAEALKELRRGETGQVINQIWPKLRAETMVKGLLSDPAALARWAEGLFDEAEQRLLLVRPQGRWAWTAADRLLVDELRWRLDRGVTFGHIIVDEAQDLSPMELRAIARRRGKSLTLLGDLAQGTTPWAATSWDGTRGHLGLDSLVVSELATAFRTPAPVMRLANLLLDRVAPTLTPPRAIRAGAEPNLVEVGPGELMQAAAVEVSALLGHPGVVGVLCPATLLAAAAAASLDTDPRVTLLAAENAKGLEFDSVLLIEPATLLGEASVTQCRLLYIALTRAVSTLSVVASQEWLPLLTVTS